MAQTFKYGNGIWANKEGSSLAYNDENGNYKPLPFNFERSSSATKINKQGLIETVGVNEPRIDYKDDSKGALLLEPQSTNYVDYSEDFSQSSWSKLNSTITLNTGISPDGSQNADNLYFNGTYNAALRKTITTTSTDVCTFSIWIKKISANYTNNINARIEVFGATVGLLLLGDALNSAAVGEFVRYSVTTSASTGGTSYFQFRSDEEATFEVWGAQVEKQSYVTSYIPTFGTASTRSADNGVSTGDLSNVINSTEGVLYAQIAALTDATKDGTLRFISLSDGTSNKRIAIYYFNAETFGIQLKDGAYEVTDLFIGGSTDRTQLNKIALYYNGNNVKAYLNGVEVYTSSSWTPFSGNTLNTLTFTDGNLISSPLYGKVKDLRVYDEALSDSELQALTTL